MFENPAAPLTQFITRVVVSWQQIADELELSWGLETGRHSLVNLSSVLVLLLLLVGGRTMRQQQQRRVVALAIALASKCTFTGQISIGDVTVYCQGGHINGGALLAILFPTSAGALDQHASDRCCYVGAPSNPLDESGIDENQKFWSGCYQALLENVIRSHACFSNLVVANAARQRVAFFYFS